MVHTQFKASTLERLRRFWKGNIIIVYIWITCGSTMTSLMLYSYATRWKSIFSSQSLRGIVPWFSLEATPNFCDRMRKIDGMIVRHCTDPCTYTHIESKIVAGTWQGLEPHHQTREKCTHTQETKTNTHTLKSQLLLFNFFPQKSFVLRELVFTWYFRPVLIFYINCIGFFFEPTHQLFPGFIKKCAYVLIIRQTLITLIITNKPRATINNGSYHWQTKAQFWLIIKKSSYTSKALLNCRI